MDSFLSSVLMTITFGRFWRRVPAPQLAQALALALRLRRLPLRAFPRRRLGGLRASAGPRPPSGIATASAAAKAAAAAHARCVLLFRIPKVNTRPPPWSRCDRPRAAARQGSGASRRHTPVASTL